MGTASPLCVIQGTIVIVDAVVVVVVVEFVFGASALQSHKDNYDKNFRKILGHRTTNAHSNL